MRRSEFALLLPFVAGLAACSGTPAAEDVGADLRAGLRASNVVVIMIDTLRADHLPIYGYGRDTAPFLSSVAAKGVVFENAYSASSTTAPAVASVFTSVYPSQHGVIAGVFATREMLKQDPSIRLNRLPEQLTTLGETFKNAGYRTYGIADNLNIAAELGFTQGFDKFVTYRYETAVAVNKKAAEWAPELTAGGKYFLYLHYMDPHQPYHPRDPWYVAATDEKSEWINAYDSEIRFTDEHIRELYELYGWDANTLLVVLADHGEEFWDHGGTGHGRVLYNELIRVPWLFYHPALGARRVATGVSTLDLLPTLAELLGFVPDEIWKGVALGAAIDGSGSAPERPIFQELRRRPEQPGLEKCSVVEAGWHLVESETESGGEPTYELYHLTDDPGEQKDLIGAEPERLTNLRARIAELNQLGASAPGREVELPVSEQVIEELNTLGYLQ